MKKLITFLVMVCVSIGAWADINVYKEIVNAYQSNEYTAYKIYGLGAGDLAAINNGTYSGTIYFTDVTDNNNNQTYNAADFKTFAATFVDVQIGGSNSSCTLNNNDVAALNMFTNMERLNMDGSTFTDETVAGDINCGSNISVVVLPNGLTKAEVNAAGAKLSSNNSDFSSCISNGSNVYDTTTLHYYYRPDGEGTTAVEITDVNNLTKNIEDDDTDNTYTYAFTRTETGEADLTLVGSDFTYQYNGQTYHVDEAEYLASYGTDQWGNSGYYKIISTDDVSVSKDVVWFDANNNQVFEQWDQPIIDGVLYYGGHWNYNPYEYVGGTAATKKYEYSYIDPTDNNAKHIIGVVGENEGLPTTDNNYPATVIDNGDGTYHAEVTLTNTQYCSITAEYRYEYTEHDGSTNVAIYNTKQADDAKKQISWEQSYSYPAWSEEEVTHHTDVTATCYVNQAGTLYKSTSYAGVQSTAKQVTISGNITLVDLANGNSDDYLGQDTQFEGTKYTDVLGTNYHAWSGNYNQLNSFDLENATLVKATADDPNDPVLYLREMKHYGNSLTTCILPANLTEVPEGCFDNCQQLSNVGWPSGLEKIGAFAFRQTAITSLYVRNTTEDIGYGAFDKCSSIEEIVFEKGLTDLTFEQNVFNECAGLKHVVLPEGVTHIGEYLFNRCSNLESVRLPSTLIEIGEGCFNQCALTQITIPENVDQIGAKALWGNPLRDIFVTNPTTAPLIYTMPNNIENDGGMPTFGRAQLINNTADPYQANVDGTVKEIDDDWETAVVKYYGQNKVCVLHYPEGAENIYDNPSITATYGLKTTDDQLLPGRNSNDYNKRVNASDTGNDGLGAWTRDGWKQFALQKAYKPNETDVLQKEYKDVWYTMCFPFNLSDEQLEEAFNSHYNICEFNNVEIKKDENSGKYSLILHFNQVAKDYSEYEDATSLTSKQKYDGDTENSTHFLAKAFHPYMIHPNLGTTETSQPVNCYFSKIRFLDIKEKCNTAEKGFYWEDGDNLVKNAAYFKKEITLNEQIEGETVSGTFTFIGNVNRYGFGNDDNNNPKHDGVVTDLTAINPNDQALIPYGAYFLSTPNILSQKPMFYMQTSTNTARTSGGLWTLYSAIILSDQTAETKIAQINGRIGGTTESPVKSLDIDFSEFESETDPTVINEIVEEAKKQDLPVQFIDIVYDFNGKIVKRGDASLENLPTGLYIVNGKKYLVK